MDCFFVNSRAIFFTKLVINKVINIETLFQDRKAGSHLWFKGRSYFETQSR